MKKLLIVLFTLLFFIHCKDKSDIKSNDLNGKEIQTSADSLIKEGFVKVEPERFIETERALAKQMLDNYLIEGAEPMALLAGREYEIDYRLVVNNKTNSKRIEGEWISFNTDFSYSWFKDHKLFQSGSYFYGIQSDLILFLGEEPSDFPSEWTLKSAGNVIVLVGTSTFKNNNTQLHLVLKENQSD